MPEWKVPGYTELKALGSGGFGEVMLARHDPIASAIGGVAPCWARQCGR